MASKRKNSLVENINRRKRTGTSRPKSRSTVSKASYEQMEEGWPKARKRKAKSSRKSGGVKTKASKSAASKKQTATKTSKQKTSKKRASKKQ